VIYAKNVEETALFYERHFSFRATSLPGDRIVELVAQSGGANIMLHQAAKGQRTGQATVKLVFDVEDVEAFAGNAPKRSSSLCVMTPPMGSGMRSPMMPLAHSLIAFNRLI
jgi:predicted enzyme related to lactoylglutathione lyase